jgi:hypothetical protein
MAIPPETEAQILRYHHAERWPIGTIATQLNLHRDSVARILAQAGLPAIHVIRRPSAVDPYLPFILETLEQLCWRNKKFPDYHRTSASFNNRAGIAGV